MYYKLHEYHALRSDAAYHLRGIVQELNAASNALMRTLVGTEHDQTVCWSDPQTSGFMACTNDFRGKACHLVGHLEVFVCL